MVNFAHNVRNIVRAVANGAIIGQHGLPMRSRSYGNWFDDIARATGISDAAWNMGARAGGAGEADEAGATITSE